MILNDVIYESVSIFTNNDLLTVTAYVHRNHDDELVLLVEYDESEVVEYSDNMPEEETVSIQ